MDEEHYSLKTTRETAYRALSLGALVFRATLDQAETYFPNRNEHERAIVNLTWWLVKQDILHHQTEWEKKCFRKALGLWSTDLISESVWRVEALTALLWALGFTGEIPPYDTLVLVEDVLVGLPFFQPIDDFLAAAALPDPGEIRRQRDIAELWLWRAGLELLWREGLREKDGQAISEQIRQGARLLADEGLADPVAGDFPVRGEPYRKLSDSDVETLANLALERHHALNWVLTDEAWETTPPL